MALGAYQKISRVTSDRPFGDGSDGAYSSATIPTMTVKACTGTATNTKFAADTDATPFEVGDVILLHQSRGTGVGQWEIVKVLSVGSDEYNTTTALNYTYAAPAQATVIKQYSSVTVQSGTWTVPGWGGTTGGILTFACNGTVTVTGNIVADYSGSQGGPSGISGGDYSWGYYGENKVSSYAIASSKLAVNNGGGASLGNETAGGGGGNGGVGIAGSGGTPAASDVHGNGAIAAGNAELTNLLFGGAGGTNGRHGNDRNTRYAGDGGGIVLIFAKDIQMSGIVYNRGQAGQNGVQVYSNDSGGGSGGGAGGSVLLICQTATLGTTKIIATGGSGGSGAAPNGGTGGAGGTGRIAVHHSSTVTGTTSPTFNDTTDATLIDNYNAAFLAFL